jgi:YVTN family beta-propeller protein
MKLSLLAFSTAACVALPAAAQNFVHFESPHVHPLERTPDGMRLLAVNTADGRLEVFDILATAPYLRAAGSIAVGVEPVSVRARTANEAWVVNHVSDSVSVVDLTTMSVKSTILTGDEPCDVVFAGKLGRAFVSCSQVNRLEVYDPANLLAAPTQIPIVGEDPRALATDGTRVYAAIFECGNDSTVIPETRVSTASMNPYAGDPNPPPNSGNSFSPPLTSGLPTSPRAGLIVRKDAAGVFRDVNNQAWTSAVTWNLTGNDVAVVNANSLSTTYAKGFMTTPAALAIAPDGRVVAVGTESKNEIRFEPNLKSIFVRSEAAVLPAGGATASSRGDLNPHLNYTVRSIPMLQRMLAIGEPRGVVVSSDGTKAYATGLGSGNIVAFNLSNYARLGLGSVGEGPTGIVLDPTAARLYTLNRFDGSISVVEESSLSEIAQVGFYDPTPTVVRNGRPFLYDTHLASGLGQASCGSCHTDARMDQLSWDLGDPSGAMKVFNESCNLGLPGQGDACGNWHPMKGPMATQTLVGLAGSEPFHWRGDRNDFQQFAHTASALLGGDGDFSAAEMTRLENYLNSISFPPNPNRNLDGSLKTSLAGGNPVTGQTLFNTGNLDFVQCVTCHTVPTGGSSQIISGNLLQEPQMMKVPHLRNMLEKTGFDSLTSSTNTRGFGFTHDGATPTLFDFFKLTVFNFASGAAGDQQRRDVTAFMLSWDTGTHASVGAQATMGGPTPNGSARRNQLVNIANAGSAQLIAKAVIGDVERGYKWHDEFDQAGSFQTDVAGQKTTLAALDALAASGTVVTYTLVPNGTGQRAIDRDGDGFLDGDERAGCSDPADPTSVPGSPCRADIANNDDTIDAADLATLLSAWGSTDPSVDLDCDGTIGGSDLAVLLSSWGPCP